MVNSLPIVCIGGPPRTGKSVLFHSLTHALHEQGVRHHILRPPDGEGNYSQESDQSVVNALRMKGRWSLEYVQRVSETLQHRCLPFLLDLGGRPSPLDRVLLEHCKHGILLLKEEEPAATQLWSDLFCTHDIQLLARLYSSLQGKSELWSQGIPLEGSLVGLVRGKESRVEGPVFAALVERIARLFTSYPQEELEQMIFEQAPSELLNLYEIVPESERWEPAQLPLLLQSLPTNKSFSVYGKTANWVYGALATHIESVQPFYLYAQNSPAYWLQLVPICTGEVQKSVMQLMRLVAEGMQLFEIKLLTPHLEYFQPEPLPFPAPQPGQGLIISGRLPQWLVTALARFYKEHGAPWIALFEPRFRQSVVIYSRTAAYQPGDLVTFPGYYTGN